MKTRTIEVGELVSTLSALGGQRELLPLPGGHHADVNCVVSCATVHHDETRVTLEAICSPHRVQAGHTRVGYGALA